MIENQNNQTNFCCRFCNHKKSTLLVDLGDMPLANAYLSKEYIDKERSFPLKVEVCQKCFLVQLPEFESPVDIFSDYAYFSSCSSSWLAHAKLFSEQVIKKNMLNEQSFVIEIASNDGYLLQNFKQRFIPHLGVEPASNIAKVAQEKGINTLNSFFNYATAQQIISEYSKADLIVANNVLAHVPNINDFVKGLKLLLAENGMISIEFPHLMNLIDENQFDTIYHEHFSYFSLIVVDKIFTEHGLCIFDIEELSTHGGSLRIFSTHTTQNKNKSLKFNAIYQKEIDKGYLSPTFDSFSQQVDNIRKDILAFIDEAKKQKKIIAAYGAAAKGNTLLNFCQITSENITMVCDKSPAKQGLLMPGSHIPIFDEQSIKEQQPDYIIILPWNLKGEIILQLSYVRKWGGKFVTAIPRLIID